MEANFSAILVRSRYLPGIVNLKFKFVNEPFLMETTHRTLAIIS
jgi:hypothetical protein